MPADGGASSAPPTMYTLGGSELSIGVRAYPGVRRALAKTDTEVPLHDSTWCPMSSRHLHARRLSVKPSCCATFSSLAAWSGSHASGAAARSGQEPAQVDKPSLHGVRNGYHDYSTEGPKSRRLFAALVACSASAGPLALNGLAWNVEVEGCRKTRTSGFVRR